MVLPRGGCLLGHEATGTSRLGGAPTGLLDHFATCERDVGDQKIAGARSPATPWRSRAGGRDCHGRPADQLSRPEESKAARWSRLELLFFGVRQ